uniref:Chromatin target of PRMT1 protein C-terminal domain-containing protein n=1 Tax=Haptolina ericina TaxID=156174 RepID=A0A7S3AEA2_9EUKA|mmetsp:Transcript_10566/g.24225  ORF Transcript_10566/g.24225 Transcript_10566/m.24225 type:complete len:144 (+) Transcript_10566:38-469(+)
MGKGTPRGGQQPKKEMIDNPLRTSKGNFQFTLVADGIYIEHQWGKNSGHIGLPVESIPKFIEYLQGFEARASGGKKRASPAKKSPAVAATGKGIDKKEKQKEQKEKKEKKEPEKKPTLEDLDADLTSYQAARKGEEAAATDGA